jgi:hypothetical protein
MTARDTNILTEKLEIFCKLCFFLQLFCRQVNVLKITEQNFRSWRTFWCKSILFWKFNELFLDISNRVETLCSPCTPAACKNKNGYTNCVHWLACC